MLQYKQIFSEVNNMAFAGMFIGLIFLKPSIPYVIYNHFIISTIVLRYTITLIFFADRVYQWYKNAFYYIMLRLYKIFPNIIYHDSYSL